MRAAGINRVSMGVQSFADEQLKACGRGHGVSEVEEGVSYLHAAGFTELSLDIMSGLPGDTIHGLERSLERAVALGPTHLSVYDLIVEEGTAFGRWYASENSGDRRRRAGAGGTGGPGGLQALPSEELAGEMYCAAHSVLTLHGFEHYEISSYARLPPGAPAAGGEDDGARSRHRSRHNMVYWTRAPFLAFGMGATSFIGGQRLARPRTLDAYSDWIEAGGAGSALVGGVEDGDEEGGDEEDAEWAELVEVLMVGFRMRHGLELRTLRSAYGDGLVNRALGCLAPHVRSKLVEVTPGGRIRLSTPQGFLFSNTVLVSLFE
jgi:coproporphyrinogen III oxidase-like Fe-S oxidoreductase